MDEEKALELYKIFKQQNSLALNTYHSHIRHYLTLVLAILSASIAAIAAVLKLTHPSPGLILCTLVGPLINFPLCLIAVKLSDRPYRVFLETISVQAKLEPIIGGLIGQRKQTPEEDMTIPFPQDKNIIPERWIDEPRQFSTAEEFVNYCMKKGSNKLVHFGANPSAV